MEGTKSFKDPKKALDHVIKLYKESKAIIRSKLKELESKNTKGKRISEEYFCINCSEATYPYVWIDVGHENCQFSDDSRSYGYVDRPGKYGTTLTQPELFYDYLLEQFTLLIQNHDVEINVSKSYTVIPLPYAIEKLSINLQGDAKDNILEGEFALPNLVNINDDIANCNYEVNEFDHYPLSLFSAERVDFSLDRLTHYTGTNVKHFQKFILLTNYQRYMNEFIKYAIKEIKSGEMYSEIVLPGNKIFTKENIDEIKNVNLAFLNQMPAYHLKLDPKYMREGERNRVDGITFINIGVGPSNAKNITDHLAVLRPHCWIMVGHCAGLRESQRLGDYVLGHAYVREDQVLNRDLSQDIPIPPIAEIQIALQGAVHNITGQSGKGFKSTLRTGTVFTTSDRNWELRTRKLTARFKRTRAIAVDMESATIAANGYRFRVPYATLLCISDKPIHGELKMKGMANEFYKERVGQHFLIGIETVNIIRKSGVESLHSRKLRGFDDPAFL